MPVLLRGLKEQRDSSQLSLGISAIVCVSDNGGSSGALRKEFRIPAVGDLRNCLTALSDPGPVLADLFQYRFNAGSGLQGHSLGNLMMTALCQKTGNLSDTVELTNRILQVKGAVLPVTDSETTLCAQLRNGNVIRGESEIRATHSKIERVWLEPDDALPASGVLETIAQADTLVLGPGSLYTSIIPNLLVAGVAEAVRNSRSLKVFVANLMTEPGETDGFTAADHLKVLECYLGSDCIEVCVLNSAAVEGETAGEYAEEGAQPVRMDPETIAAIGTLPISADLVTNGPLKIRHHAGKLAHLIVSMTRGVARTRPAVPPTALVA